MKTVTPLGALTLLLGLLVGMTTSASAATIARATAQVVNGFVIGVTVTDGGSGYDAIPTVTFIGGGGSGAGAYATVSGESVVSITVTNAGTGYTNAPAVELSAPPGTVELSVPQMFAGMVVRGVTGLTYQIQFVTNLTNTNNWTTLTNLALTTSPWLFIDNTSPGAARRFYRAVGGHASPILIPSGSFTMGNTFGTSNPWEVPVHSVFVSAFYMDRYEVSKALWDEVRIWSGDKGYGYESTGLAKATNHPVNNISWYDAVKWCNARSEKDGLTPCYYSNVGLTVVYKTGQTEPYVRWTANGHRLPTEAEWEKAARGGASGHRFPWSDTDTITHFRANYESVDGFAYDVSLTRGFHPVFNDGVRPYTNPVDYFLPNAYGLHDMTGNQQEWCWDWFDTGWYSKPGASASDTRGPAGPPIDPLNNRVVRGGTWLDVAGNVTCAHRDGRFPTNSNDSVTGFRCARGL